MLLLKYEYSSNICNNHRIHQSVGSAIVHGLVVQKLIIINILIIAPHRLIFAYNINAISHMNQNY